MRLHDRLTRAAGIWPGRPDPGRTPEHVMMLPRRGGSCLSPTRSCTWPRPTRPTAAAPWEAAVAGMMPSARAIWSMRSRVDRAAGLTPRRSWPRPGSPGRLHDPRSAGDPRHADDDGRRDPRGFCWKAPHRMPEEAAERARRRPSARRDAPAWSDRERMLLRAGADVRRRGLRAPERRGPGGAAAGVAQHAVPAGHGQAGTGRAGDQPDARPDGRERPGRARGGGGPGRAGGGLPGQRGRAGAGGRA